MQQKNGLIIGAWLSFGVFIVLLIGSMYYYQERMLFADASHIAFSAINAKGFQIQQYRFGSFITQMVPIIGAKMGLSLKAILLAYSMSFHLFYLFVAGMLLFVFKAYRLLILYALYWLLVTSHTFFWSNNEVHQGVAYMFLMFPMLLRAGEKKMNFAVPVMILFVLGSTAIFCHPLVIPPFIYLLVYLIAEKEHWPFNKKQTIILCAVLVLIIAIKLFVSKVYAGYDQKLLMNMDNLKPTGILDAFSSPLALEIYRHVPANYWILPIVALIGIIGLVVKRKFFLAIWTLGCTVMYFILLCLTFKGYMEFISESEMMAGIIIATAPFVFVVLQATRREIVGAIVLFIFISRYRNFEGASVHFSQRVLHLSNALAKVKDSGLRKVVFVREQPGIPWKWMVEWGTSAESMLLSSTIWDKPTVQFVIMPPAEVEKRVPKNNHDIIACFRTMPIEELDTRYFTFDTTRPYTILPYEKYLE